MCIHALSSSISLSSANVSFNDSAFPSPIFSNSVHVSNSPLIIGFIFSSFCLRLSLPLSHIPNLFFADGALYPEIIPESDSTVSDVTTVSPLIGLNRLAFRLHRFRPTRTTTLKIHFTADGNESVWNSTLIANPPQIISLPPGDTVIVINVSANSELIVAAVNGSVSPDDVTSEKYSIEVSVQDPVSIDDGYPSTIPLKTELEQNYPNPFNPVTSIRYSLLKSGDVFLIIYNLQGQEIIRWDEQNAQTGYYHKTWDATNFASGIYFYRLQADDFIQTRKMVLLK